MRASKSFKAIVILYVVCLLGGVQLFAEEASRVGVLGFRNLTGLDSYQGAADTVSNTAEITLFLIGEYTILPLDEEIDPRDLSELRDVARSHRLDYLLSGGIFMNSDNEIEVSMSVYDNALDRNIAEKSQTADSLFGIFDAVDEVLVEVIGKFSNRHIGWGEIRFANRGSLGVYSVRLDDIELGRDATGFSNILIGKRRLEITQERPFGPLVVFDDFVDIVENESFDVEFTIPGITRTEQFFFDATWTAINEAVSELDRDMAIEHFDVAFDLLERAEVSEELIALRETWTRRFTGINSEIDQRANEENSKETASAVESPPEPVEKVRQFAAITVDRRRFGREVYTFDGVEYGRTRFKGYQHFYTDLLITPGLSQSLRRIVSEESIAEAKAHRQFYDGIIIAVAGLAMEAVGVGYIITGRSSFGVSVYATGGGFAVVGAIAALIGSIQTSMHRPSRTVVPEFNRYADGEEAIKVAVTGNEIPDVETSSVDKPSATIPEGFVLVEGGTFTMGSPESENGRYDDENQHRVTVGDYIIGKHEVTFTEYDAFCDDTGRGKPHDQNWGREDRPVVNVSWFEAVEYCNWFSRNEGLEPAYQISGTNVTWNRNADGYRLPTEAEWEYAARGGKESRGHVYSGSGSLVDVAWYRDNSGRQTHPHPVGQKRENELGIFDMSGNVWERCWDWYGEYPSEALIDPSGPSSGEVRVNRGGGWGSSAGYCRIAIRDWDSPGNSTSAMGFRVAALIRKK